MRAYIALLLGAVAFVLVIVITSGDGPGLDPDSMEYVGAATSFAHTGALRVPSSSWDAEDSTASLTGWPPGLSIAMAIPQKLGIPALTSARLVLAIAAFISASVLFILLEGTVGVGVAIFAVVAFLATPAVVGVHTSVLSEPLFLASLIVTLFLMTRRPRRPLIAGIPAGVAAIVRYAGIFVPMAIVLWFFFVDRRSLRQRFTEAVKAAVMPAALVGALVIRNSRVTDGEPGAQLAINGNWAPTLRQGLRTLIDWLVPGTGWWMERGIIALALAACIAVIGARVMKSVRSDLLKATTVLIACYITVLFSARLLIGDGIPFDFRILSPIIVLGEILIAVALGHFLQTSTKRIRLAVAAVFALWLTGSLITSARYVHDAITDGSDFASSSWRSSPTLAWVQRHSAGRALFTNWPAAVYFHTSRIARDVPQSLDSASLKEFRGILDEQHGALVGFSVRNTDYPPTDSIARKMGLVALARLSDGTVWVTSESLRQ